MRDKTKLILFFFAAALTIAGTAFVFLHPNQTASLGFFVPATTALFGGISRNGVSDFMRDLKRRLDALEKRFSQLEKKFSGKKSKKKG